MECMRLKEEGDCLIGKYVGLKQYSKLLKVSKNLKKLKKSFLTLTICRLSQALNLRSRCFLQPLNRLKKCSYIIRWGCCLTIKTVVAFLWLWWKSMKTLNGNITASLRKREKATMNKILLIIICLKLITLSSMKIKRRKKERKKVSLKERSKKRSNLKKNNRFKNKSLRKWKKKSKKSLTRWSNSLNFLKNLLSYPKRVQKEDLKNPKNLLNTSVS